MSPFQLNIKNILSTSTQRPYINQNICFNLPKSLEDMHNYGYVIGSCGDTTNADPGFFVRGGLAFQNFVYKQKGVGNVLVWTMVHVYNCAILDKINMKIHLYESQG